MTLEEFKKLNKQSGSYWFSESTMKFFKSKVCDWDNETGYFITSEIDPSNVKMYTIRYADFKTGKVKTIGNFHSYKTLAGAKSGLRSYLNSI